jgi:hypothetical protein
MVPTGGKEGGPAPSLIPQNDCTYVVITNSAAGAIRGGRTNRNVLNPAA